MGRPIKKKFFGNLNGPDAGSVPLGSGVGGEGINTAIVKNPAANSDYSTTTSVTWVASAPQLPGGTAASGTTTVSGAGRITALQVVDAGTGYTSTGSVTVTFSPATTGTAATVALTLTSSVQNALSVVAYIPTGSSGLAADIVKQEASKRYLVATSEGTGQCKLVSTSTVAAGEMYIVATDSLGATYFVTKLTAHRAYLSKYLDGGSGFEYAQNAVAGWTIGSAATGVVSIGSV